MKHDVLYVGRPFCFAHVLFYYLSKYRPDKSTNIRSLVLVELKNSLIYFANLSPKFYRVGLKLQNSRWIFNTIQSPLTGSDFETEKHVRNLNFQLERR